MASKMKLKEKSTVAEETPNKIQNMFMGSDMATSLEMISIAEIKSMLGLRYYRTIRIHLQRRLGL